MQGIKVFFKGMSICLVLFFIGCGGAPNRAPVVNLKTHPRPRIQTTAVMISPVYVVPARPQKIGLSNPHKVKNQISKLPMARSQVTVSPLQPSKPKIAAPLLKSQFPWIWPHRGQILRNFQNGAKGIDIAGIPEASVKASAKGTVVYSGSGLKGYGNLIIIKHEEDFLSAYAHNSKLMVKEGERVILGQEIAKIGKTGTDRVKLHFEIRYKGKPVDPLQFLPKNP